MHLDALTLMAAGSFVAGISGLLLFGAWMQIRSARALLWWAIANGIDAIAISGLAAGLATHRPLTIAIANGFLVVTPPLVWGGVRTFNRRRVPPIALVAGPLAWLAVGLLPLPGGPEAAPTGASFAVWIAYLAAANVELWRSRGEPLRARWPLMGLFSLHALIFLAGIIHLLTGGTIADAVPPLTSVFGLIHFENLTYTIGTAVFMVVMAKERVELGYISAAQFDALTGVANRGAFFQRAERLLRRCHEDAAPCSVIVFDLDDFKHINDTHGHAAGDRTLRAFAEAARTALRPNDLFGRVGGEEFAVVLPAAAAEVAYVIADRVRHGFAATTGGVADEAINATVSAGVAVVPPGRSLEAAIELADRALYRAKRLGRNRVERIDDDGGARDSNVIRVA